MLPPALPRCTCNRRDITQQPPRPPGAWWQSPHHMDTASRIPPEGTAEHDAFFDAFLFEPASSDLPAAPASSAQHRCNNAAVAAAAEAEASASVAGAKTEAAAGEASAPAAGPSSADAAAVAAAAAGPVLPTGGVVSLSATSSSPSVPAAAAADVAGAAEDEAEKAGARGSSEVAARAASGEEASDAGAAAADADSDTSRSPASAVALPAQAASEAADTLPAAGDDAAAADADTDAAAAEEVGASPDASVSPAAATAAVSLPIGTPPPASAEAEVVVGAVAPAAAAHAEADAGGDRTAPSPAAASPVASSQPVTSASASPVSASAVSPLPPSHTSALLPAVVAAAAVAAAVDGSEVEDASSTAPSPAAATASLLVSSPTISPVSGVALSPLPPLQVAAAALLPPTTTDTAAEASASADAADSSSSLDELPDTSPERVLGLNLAWRDHPPPTHPTLPTVAPTASSSSSSSSSSALTTAAAVTTTSSPPTAGSPLRASGSTGFTRVHSCDMLEALYWGDPSHSGIAAAEDGQLVTLRDSTASAGEQAVPMPAAAASSSSAAPAGSEASPAEDGSAAGGGNGIVFAAPSGSPCRMLPLSQDGSFESLLAKVQTPSSVMCAAEAAAQHAECAVCFEPLCKGHVVVFINHRKARVCRHYFHEACVRDLRPDLQGVFRCPLCRSPFEIILRMPDPRVDEKEWFRLASTREAGTLSRVEVKDVLLATVDTDEGVVEEVVENKWAGWDRLGTGYIERPHADGLFEFVRMNLPGRRDDPPPDLFRDRGAWFEFFDKEGRGVLAEGRVARGIVKSFASGEGSSAVVEVAAMVREMFGLFASSAAPPPAAPDGASSSSSAAVAAATVDDPSAHQASITKHDFVKEDGLSDAIVAALLHAGVAPSSFQDTADAEFASQLQETYNDPEASNPTVLSVAPWACPQCTFLNPTRKRRCGACHKKRPKQQVDDPTAVDCGGNAGGGDDDEGGDDGEDSEGEGGGGAGGGDDGPVGYRPPQDEGHAVGGGPAGQEWPCAVCTFLNNPQLQSCGMCGTARAPVPRAGAGGGGGGGARGGVYPGARAPRGGGQTDSVAYRPPDAPQQQQPVPRSRRATSDQQPRTAPAPRAGAASGRRASLHELLGMLDRGVAAVPAGARAGASASAPATAAPPQPQPRWEPDTESTTCRACDSGFSFFNRRHHCRGCGKLFCYQCAPLRRSTRHPYREERLCEPCIAARP